MNTLKPPEESCPYCHSDAAFDFHFYKRFYFHCKICDLIFEGDRHLEAEKKYYECSYFSDYAHDQLSGARNHIYSHILNIIEEEVAVGKVLDVGCGCGFFLKEARDRGWNIAGIDPSEESIEYSGRLLGGKFAHKATLKDLSQENEFDVVTMIDALGFSSEPWADIEKATFLLKQKGLLFLRFSNGLSHSTFLKISTRLKIDSFVNNLFVFHTYSLTPRFINRLLSVYGFSNISIRNAKSSEGGFMDRFLKSAIGIAVNSLYFISSGKIIIGPSIEVIARKA